MEFMELIQGSKMVLQYKANFMELAKFSSHISGDDERKAMEFQRIASWHMDPYGCITTEVIY